MDLTKHRMHPHAVNVKSLDKVSRCPATTTWTRVRRMHLTTAGCGPASESRTDSGRHMHVSSSRVPEG